MSPARSLVDEPGSKLDDSDFLDFEALCHLRKLHISLTCEQGGPSAFVTQVAFSTAVDCETFVLKVRQSGRL